MNVTRIFTRRAVEGISAQFSTRSAFALQISAMVRPSRSSNRIRNRPKEF
jgi:hypothetical protein